MTTYYDVCTRWVDIHTGSPELTPRRCARLFPRGNKIYSYGEHFEMARALAGRDGDTALFLINGDRYSVTTSRHQSEVRSAIARSRYPQVIIPFSALSAAGIDLDTVVLLDRTADRRVETEHVAYAKPPLACWDLEPITEEQPLADADIEAILDERHAAAMADWQRKHGWAQNGGTGDGYWAGWAARPENLAPPVVETVEDLLHLGDRHAYVTVNGLIRRYDGKKTVVVGQQKILRARKNSWHRIDFEELPDGRTEFRWTTSRHWLGESLIQAKIVWTGFTPCKACGSTGRAEGPAAINEYHPDEYYESLRPVCPQCRGQRGRHWIRSRTATFLSGFDHNERRESYFFCELPPKRDATSIEEAYAALKPDVVAIAEQMGREVRRQGDIFAIPLSAQTTRRALRKAGARFQKRGELLGTNHEATEVAHLPGGATIVRGCLYHNPQGRRPDHARVRLGERYHVVVKNTVPTTRGRR